MDILSYLYIDIAFYISSGCNVETRQCGSIVAGNAFKDAKSRSDNFGPVTRSPSLLLLRERELNDRAYGRLEHVC